MFKQAMIYRLGRFYVAPAGICDQHQRADIARWPVKEAAP